VSLLNFEDPLFKERIFETKRFILLFQPFRNVLQLNIAFNFTLFICLNSGLKFSQLRLLSLAECTLRSTLKKAE
jgi:hypothetical protein